MIRVFQFFVLIFIPATNFASTPLVESQQKSITPDQDTVQLTSSLLQAVAAKETKPDSVPFFALQAVAVANRILDSNQYSVSVVNEVKDKKMQALTQMIEYYSILRFQFDSALFYSNLLLENAQQYYDAAPDESHRKSSLKWMANALMDIGVVYFEQSQLDSAIVFYTQSLEKSKELNDTLLQSKTLLNIGMVYTSIGRYDDAMQNYFAAIERFEHFDDKKGVAICYLSIGSIQRRLKSPERAVDSYQKALNMFVQLDDERGQSACYNNLGIAYDELKDYEKALAYYKKALAIYEKRGKKRSIARMHSNIAVLYEEIKDYEKAIESLQKAMALSQEINSRRNLAGTHINLAGIYLSMIQDSSDLLRTQPAYADTILKHAQIGKQMADSLGYISDMVGALEVLKKAYAIRGDYQNAYATADNLIELNDSVYNTEKLKIIAEADTKYQATKNEIQIKQQQHDITDRELELENARLLRNFLAITSILLLLVLASFYYLYQQKHKANRKLDEKNHLINEKNKEITARSEELEAAYKKMSELLRFKEKMTGMIVHDLKNPVNNILNSHVIDDLEFREKLINQSGYDMLNLIQNILDLHQMEEAHVELHRDLTFLVPVLRESIFELSLYISEKKLNVVYPENESVYFSVDRRLLKRIFSNLLSNAVKYAPDDSEIKIETGIINPGTRRFSIRNLGDPIPPKVQAVLFERFSQFDPKSIGNNASTGLGLAFCKMAVELHGGQIGVVSDEKATEFWFTIPNSTK